MENRTQLRCDWGVRIWLTLIPTLIIAVLPYVWRVLFPHVNIHNSADIGDAYSIAIVSTLVEVSVLLLAGFLSARSTSNIKNALFVGLMIGVGRQIVRLLAGVLATGALPAFGRWTLPKIGLLIVVVIVLVAWTTALTMIGGLLARPWKKTD